MNKTLLAKSPIDRQNPEHEETLVGHIEMVIKMGRLMVRTLSDNVQKTLQLSHADLEIWKEAVLIGCWLHDLGKANSHFQKMIIEHSLNQGARHEAVSLIIALELEEFLNPLWRGSDLLKAASIYAACGHHLKFPDPYEDNREGSRLTVYYSHADFHELLRMGQDELGAGAIEKELADTEYSLLRKGDLKKSLKTLRKELDYDFSDHEKALIATVKSTVIASDLAGSAIPPRVDSSEEWLRDRLGRVLSSEQLESVVHKKLGGNTPVTFQEELAQLESHTILVEAGCGSGKTIGAYLWASNQAKNKRLFFCYPTTATASEGFAGYMQDPDFDAVLIHSRAKVDYKLLQNMPNRRHEENELRAAGLEALETWPMPVAICTAHTVLGILENVRRGIYSWPSLARSVFVFDEIHAFSGRLFSYLLRFLKTFKGLNVLLMTATLTDDRRKALERICEERSGLKIIYGPQKREKAPRYKLYRSTASHAWEEVNTVIQKGGKVLWISNTVARAMQVYEQALEMNLPVKPFHSRYRYKDRLARQRQVIDGFHPDSGPMLATTTQIAEMSLDISADLLVSEYAPVPNLIQRLGRVNRFGEAPKSLKSALFIEPDNILPYTAESWQPIDPWLEIVADGSALSQENIKEAFQKVSDHMETQIGPIPFCEWIDGGWRTLKGQQSIEESSHTTEIIREEDCHHDPAENSIPMPIPKFNDWQDWPRKGRFIIAPSGKLTYDPIRGATWNYA